MHKGKGKVLLPSRSFVGMILSQNFMYLYAKL